MAKDRESALQLRPEYKCECGSQRNWEKQLVFDGTISDQYVCPVCSSVHQKVIWRRDWSRVQATKEGTVEKAEQPIRNRSEKRAAAKTVEARLSSLEASTKEFKTECRFALGELGSKDAWVLARIDTLEAKITEMKAQVDFVLMKVKRLKGR